MMLCCAAHTAGAEVSVRSGRILRWRENTPPFARREVLRSWHPGVDGAAVSHRLKVPEGSRIPGHQTSSMLSRQGFGRIRR